MDYAVVIGIDHYESNPLKAAVVDATRFANWLVEFKLVENSPKTLKKLISGDTDQIADYTDIDSAIESVIKDAKANHVNEKNRLYFYFAGHGIGVTFDKTALCLRKWPLWFSHCISSIDYKNWFINAGIFDEVLIFLDCCRGIDQLIDAKSPSPMWRPPVGNRRPSLLICNSTLLGKLSYETAMSSISMEGVFTSFLLQALSGDADIDDSGVITTGKLKEHVNKNFSYTSGNEVKQQGDAFTQGVQGDDIVICRIEKTAPAPAHNFEIVFKRNSNITLKGRDTLDMKTGDVLIDEKWQLKLDQGFYVMIDNHTGETKLITNYSVNTMSHDEF